MSRTTNRQANVKHLPPAHEIIDAPYELKELQAPVLRGVTLSAFIRVFESSLGAWIYPVLARQSGITQVLKELRLPDAPLFEPDPSPVTDDPEPFTEQLEPPLPGPNGGDRGASGAAAERAAATILLALNRGLLPHSLQLQASKEAPVTIGTGGGAGLSSQGPLQGTSPETPTATSLDAAEDGLGEARGKGKGGDAGRTGCEVVVSTAPPAPWAFSGGPTIVDYARAYRSGSGTPSQVAERIIQFVEAGIARSPPLGMFVSWDAQVVREQAEDSTRRFQEGKPRSILEGVPFAIKDVADALPYCTTAGTTFISADRPVTADAPFVSTLRSLGAVLLGKTSLHEIGLGITGLNVRSAATALNPHGLGSGAGQCHCYYTGGSSSGSAAVVAAGLCPIAIGSDGGGSIRVPSSWCGLVGLKPSAGRVGGSGAVEVDCTVATLGPMAGCVQDAALLHAVMCLDGPLVEELPQEGGQWPRLPTLWPRLETGAAGGQPLKGLRIGVYDKWFDHSSLAVGAVCRSALLELECLGAEVVAVVVPELEHLRVAHTVTIVSEMMHNFRDQYDNVSRRAAFNSDVRLSLSNARFWSPADYLQAQRIRSRANVHFRRVLSQVHMIATPTTPIPAPRIHPHALRGGESNLQQVSRTMRFVVAANMLGLPAISLPVGWVPPEEEGSHIHTHQAPQGHDQGTQQQQPRAASAPAIAAAPAAHATGCCKCPAVFLPVGLQLVGRPLQEATLLRVGAALEAALSRRELLRSPSSQESGAGAALNSRLPALYLNPLTGERRSP